MKERIILDDLERELRGRLLVDLLRVAVGEDSLYFYNSDHNPFQLPKSKLSKRGAEAYRLACQIRDLRGDLGEVGVCEASLFLEAIGHHANNGNPHRLGPKRLAAKLADDLQTMKLRGAG